MAGKLIDELEVLEAGDVSDGQKIVVAGGATVARRLAMGALKTWIQSWLGNSATRDVGTDAGTVAAGDDARLQEVYYSIFVAGKPAAGAVVFASELPFALNFAVTDIKVTAGTTASASCAFSFKLQGVEFASGAFSAGGGTTTNTGNGAVGAVDNLLQIVAPTAQDVNLANIRIRIKGVRL